MRFCNIIIVCLILCSQGVASGDLVFSAYNEGTSLSQLKLKVQDKEYVTDEDGFLSLELPNGEYEVSIYHSRKPEVLKVIISEDEQTHVIYNKFSKSADLSVVKPTLGASADLATRRGSGVGVTSVPTGFVAGKITDMNSGQPASGVKIFVKGQSQYAVTNSQGTYKLSLPEGIHSLSLSHKKFSTEIINQVVVKKETVTEQSVELTPSGLSLEDFVVLAPRVAGSIEALIEVRKSSNQVADVMGREQMAKSGDSNAAGSLKRVTGLSLVDGKYIYVRGLGERYSNTLLNGMAIPSPDPSRRVVPLDLFPAGVLESLVVQKSFSPDRPGEFGGGTVSLKTNSIPDKAFLKFSLSQSLRDGAEGLTYKGGSTDWLGIDDGTRDLPSGLDISQPSFGDALQKFSNVHNSSTLNENQRMPNFSIAFGNRHRIYKRWRLGYLLSGLYADKREVTFEDRAETLLSEDGLKPIDPKTRTRSQRSIKLGGIFGLGLKYGRSHEVTLNQVLLRNTNDNVYYTKDLNNTFENGQERTMFEWTESQLSSTLLQGEHKLNLGIPVKLRWNAALSEARLKQPDRREYGYEVDNDTGVKTFLPLLGTASGYERRYTELNERAEEFKASLVVPFRLWNQLPAEFEVGSQQLVKDRVSQMQRYNLVFLSDPGNFGVKPDAAPETIIGECLGKCLKYDNSTSRTDNYSANQRIQSAFVRWVLPLHRRFKLDTGMRLEESVQNVASVSAFDAAGSSLESRLKTKNLLPSTSVTLKLTEKMQIRGAVSETISRPDLRELSSTLWIDNERGFEVLGNPDLQSAVIKNYDLRWEWYFRRKENISIGLFRKEFNNPVEQIFTTGADPVITFQNVGAAENYGYEIEYRKSLAFMKLPKWSLSGNYSYIRSEVQVGNLTQSSVTSTERPLQGQSPYMVNLMLDYENEVQGINSSLIYNVFGERISTLGVEGNPDEYQMPFHQLDFTLSKKFSKGLSLRFKAINLLNRPLEFKRSEVVARSRRKGRSYGLSLSMRL